MNSAYVSLPGSGHYVRRRVRLAGFSRSMALFALILMLVSLGIFRLGGLEPRLLALILAGAGAIAALALALGLGGIVKAWVTGAAGGGIALRAVLLALLALVPFGLAAYLAVTNPALSRAATPGLAASEDGADGADIPVVGTQPIVVNDTVVVGGRRFSAAAPSIYAAVRIVLTERGWEVGQVLAGDPGGLARRAAGPRGNDLGISGTVLVPVPTPRAGIDAADAEPLDRPDSELYQIDAIARDPVFALPSRVTIRVAQENGEAAVDLRSESETLAMDFGQNRRFIEAFLASLDAAVALQETEQAGG